MTDFYGRFAQAWASGSSPSPPTDAQAAQGFSFLGTTKPSAQLHDAMFQWNDQKDNYLYAQIASVYSALQSEIAEDSPSGLGSLLEQFFAPLKSPAFTGQPTVPTPDSSANDQEVPNTAWVLARLLTLQQALASYEAALQVLPTVVLGNVGGNGVKGTGVTSVFKAPATGLYEFDARAAGAAGATASLGSGGGGGGGEGAGAWISAMMAQGDTCSLSLGGSAPRSVGNGVPGMAADQSTVIFSRTRSNTVFMSTFVLGGGNGGSNAAGPATASAGGIGGLASFAGDSTGIVFTLDPGQDGGDGGYVASGSVPGGNGGGKGGRSGSGSNGGLPGLAAGSGGGGEYIQPGGSGGGGGGGGGPARVRIRRLG